ncbi:MAG TPA: methylated-DNA--[protein]-cysteine S-methyltransferase [Candidatus Thermoplasmatota archaeon]|nr:methylated-DNA--[protein]-cysteine S-methyltransferase [Candidatus Thermoplasmatota archaeon]
MTTRRAPSAWAETSLPTPVGLVRLVATDRGLAYVGNQGERPERQARWAARHLAGAARVDALPVLDEARAQLAAYFEGRRKAFDLPLDAEGTPFQERVWEALRRVPYGATTTYARLAADLGAPGSERAVGGANGANPLSIVVPCHRVVGSDGALTGYAGGVRTKARLLQIERERLGQTRLPG